MLTYPVTLTPGAHGRLLAGFPDVPSANSDGNDQEHALIHALEELESAFQTYVEDGKPVPMPSPDVHAQATLTLSPQSTAKLLLWNEMLAKQVSKSELARRLDLPPSQVTDLYDFTRPSSLDLIDMAARALGRRIELTLA
jgi:antitoxin HicB